MPVRNLEVSKVTSAVIHDVIGPERMPRSIAYAFDSPQLNPTCSSKASRNVLARIIAVSISFAGSQHPGAARPDGPPVQRSNGLTVC